jgi:hypothetical protein
VATETERDLNRLEAELKRLEAEYNMFFGGRLPRPPWETRSRVAALVKQYDRRHIQNYGDRFRFTTLQSRYAALVDLWDRGQRAREEGRPGPFAYARADPAGRSGRAEVRILYVASFRDPLREMDKLQDLYDAVVEARRKVGQDALPFHRFAELVKNQVEKLRSTGSPEVAFRVALKGGKVNLTARALKGATGSG